MGEGKVEGVPAGIYLYRRDEHTLKMLREGASFKNSLQRRRIGSGLRKPALTSFSSLIFGVVCCEKGVVELPHLCAGILGEKVYLAAVGLGLDVWS